MQIIEIYFPLEMSWSISRNTQVAQQKKLHDFIDDFYTEKNRQPKAEEFLPLVNDERSKGSHALVGLKSLRDAISTWKRAHPEIEKEKSVHDCIDDLYAERGRLQRLMSYVRE